MVYCGVMDVLVSGVLLFGDVCVFDDMVDGLCGELEGMCVVLEMSEVRLECVCVVVV